MKRRLNTFLLFLGCSILMYSQDISIQDIEYSWNGTDMEIVIEAGARNHLTIRDIAPTSGIVKIINESTGKVQINSTTGFGLKFVDCKNFVLTGTGSTDQYGIEVTKSGSSCQNGISLEKCTDYTIENVYVHTVEHCGISAQPAVCTDPNLGLYWEGMGWPHENIIIQNCKIEDVDGHGINIGSENPFSAGNYNGTSVYPTETENVKIIANIIDNPYDAGIRIGHIVRCEIRENTITDYCTTTNLGAIYLRIPSDDVSIHRNIIYDGVGAFIKSFGKSDIEIFNNVCSGTTGYGIWILDNDVDYDQDHVVKYNTIVNSVLSAIFVENDWNTNSTSSIDWNKNIIVQDGEDYDDIVGPVNVSESLNYETDIIGSCMFANISSSPPDFRLEPGSPAHNTAYHKSVIRDVDGLYRPTVYTDKGAHENLYNPWINETTAVSALMILSEDLTINTGDYLGAFYYDGDTLKCGGFMEWKGVEDTLTIYGEDDDNPGFEQDEEFLWIVWDSTYCEEDVYLAEYDDRYNQAGEFTENGISRMTGIYQYQKLILDSGWNIFSTYIDPVNDSIEVILKDIESNVETIEDYSSSYTPDPYYNDLYEVETGKAYKIKMSADDTLIIKGTVLRPEENPIPLNTTSPSWNLLGYLMKTTELVEPLLEPIISNVNIIKDEDAIIYWPAFNINNLVNLTPGEGYEIQMSSSDTLTYPLNRDTFFMKSYSVPKLKSQYYCCNLNTGNNLSLGILKSAWATEPYYGDEIGVFDYDGRLVGSGVYESENLAITVWGNDKTNATKNGLFENEEFMIKIYHKADNTEDTIRINSWVSGNNHYNKNKVCIAGKIQNEKDLPCLLYQNTPNPCENTTTISYYLSEETSVDINVINVLGKTVLSKHFESQLAGNHSVVFDISALNKGNYFYSLKTRDASQTKILTIIK